MTNLIKWNASAGGWEAALSTGLNALADGSSVSSSAFANSTDLLIGMDVSVHLASLTPGAGGYGEIHITYLEDDGSTYPDVFAGGPTLLWAFALSTGASAKNIIQGGFQIAPGDFKIAYLNKAGAALGATLNTVKVRRYALNANA